MNTSLNGNWCYRSFRHDPIVVDKGEVVGEPELAVPWAPRGVLLASTSADGTVSGTLTFAPGVVLEVSGAIVPATETCLASVTLIGKGLGSVNRIKGFFMPESGHVVGTILCTANDLLKQPNGTAGPFVLMPIKP